MMTSILSDDNARAEEFGLNSPLKLSRPAAAKTGTTENFRDDWTVGYTPDISTAVWVGNNNNSPINGLNGIQGAAPIWHAFMEFANAGLPAHDFTKPDGITTAKVCLLDGGLANPWDKAVADEVYLTGQAPKQQCGSNNPNPPKPPEQPKPESPPADNPPADNSVQSQGTGTKPKNH
jgi:membrane carboxypeptidase/penicillin-binding protein